MDQLISVINELHDAFAGVKMNIKLNLPQIAVVGSQSCGKSSVLESIVGKDFLPRGSGIVTRCPLVLQLVQLPKSNEEEWGEFLHIPNKKFYDFNEIQNEITRRTIEMAGPSAITDKPISLKVYSNTVLNLTLVDLPGLVMNAVGDQPKDIDRQIKDMVTRYVSPKNTIILAISPANTDLATSQSLRLAKQLDPEGVRTVGVLTKIDLMDKGTDCFDVLQNKVLQLRHGFVGVVCRSQQDINDRKSMEAARRSEYEFFANSPIYSPIAEEAGTAYLSKKLNFLLLEHIKAVIPDLKRHVDQLMEATKKQMEKLGMFEQDITEPTAQLLYLIKLFSDTLNQTIDGGITDATKELLGGARLDYIFHECFATYVTSLSATKDLTDDYIRINTRNMAGMHATLFPSDQVFVALSKQQITRLEEPCIKCVTFVYEELTKIVEICAGKVDRYPNLKDAIISICKKMLLDYRLPTSTHVRTIIKAERGFINVKHPMMDELAQRAFANIYGTTNGDASSPPRNSSDPNASAAGGTQADPKQSGRDIKRDDRKDDKRGGRDEKRPEKSRDQGNADNVMSPGSKSDMNDVPSRIMLGKNMTMHEQYMNSAIREMVEGYFSIVKGNVADQVPKAITLLMITRLREEVYARLVSELYSDKTAKALLSEPPGIATQRKAAKEMLEALTKAQNALNSVRDYQLTKEPSSSMQAGA
ncbi:dynamin-1-like protein [Leishmania donovani]|uniref:Dynamin-1-like_protein n=3 Tax=Leishmania donovani species complex TaxID=38574 RepID=A0A6L0XJ11_LEIIN|nr:putative GTP-binding protein [Leishmania infantum JPCM5]TPP50676.1 Dynamin central region family protein [Leishmania donovani]CAC9509983.1 dynamin-1-like_protein [Leishmania infantum]CAJ1990713.1 dynamin-1-like protein [Leishmania donovani]CAM69795.1 putative GTP-binding protein [Leishmania infantum JPCM5]SUZ43743.1 dynamin-1-like_protein [Leishmania infantum]|eukprot:XP_001466748.1 putative GTP-binding protein [Leishmania infantum JPCM5]